MNIDRLLDDEKVFAVLSDSYPVSYVTSKGKILLNFGRDLPEGRALPGSVLNLGKAPDADAIYDTIVKVRLVQGESSARHRNTHLDRVQKMHAQYQYR